MRSGTRRRVTGWLGASAFSAVVAAHALTYFLAAPDHHARSELLHETGHGSWTSTFVLAGAALVAALVMFASRWAAPGDRDAAPGSLFVHAARRLVPLQVIGFLVLECSERAIDHLSALSALTEPVVMLGVFVQVIVGLGCALLLVAFRSLVRRLRSSLPPAPEHARVLVPAGPAPHIPRPVARRAWNLRGPPQLLRSN